MLCVCPFKSPRMTNLNDESDRRERKLREHDRKDKTEDKDDERRREERRKRREKEKRRRERREDEREVSRESVTKVCYSTPRQCCHLQIGNTFQVIK